MTARYRLGLLALLAAGGACRAQTSQLDHDVLAQRAARLAENRTRPDSGPGHPVARWLLPPALAEVSGLALDSAGRLFATPMSRGRIFEINYRVGVLVKGFDLGRRTRMVDFEGMTIAGDRFFLLESNGRIYEFQEGQPGQTVPFTLHDTRLGRECEFEGIAFDARSNALLLACKNVGTNSLKDHVVIYRWPLDGARDSAQARDPTPARIAIPLAQAVGSNEWRELKPSDLTVDPLSGNYLIIAAQQQALLAVTPEGRVVSSGPLPEPLEFAEGLAATSDSLLIIATEATRGSAAISVYRRPARSPATRP